RLMRVATCACALAVCSRVTAQDALVPGPNPVVAAPGVYHLTLEDARQRALATSKGLGLAHLGIHEKREATAAARTDYLPKLLGNVAYFHFNDNLGTVATFRRTGMAGLPPGTTTVPVTAINQDSSLSSITLAQPITKLIAINAAVKLAEADE